MNFVDSYVPDRCAAVHKVQSFLRQHSTREVAVICARPMGVCDDAIGKNLTGCEKAVPSLGPDLGVFRVDPRRGSRSCVGCIVLFPTTRDVTLKAIPGASASVPARKVSPRVAGTAQGDTLESTGGHQNRIMC